ncbi:MAG TPA: sigma-70 family RNA polymerase sigma factor [Chryseolinea sp.]|nr:sigma-70 family RNA polymerase sigma factor [Chryseolinea sp.]
MLADIQSDTAKTHPITTRLQSLDDAHLWLNVSKDNELAFSILYKKYTQRLYNYGMHNCHDRDLVVDCLQELFTSLWSKRKSLSVVQSVNAYLFKSFRCLLVKKITWRKRFLLSLDASHEKSFGITLPVEDVMEIDENEKDRNARLTVCIKALTKRQREAVFLKFYNDLTYSDIATIMELQIDSVYNIISKALESLRQQLK